ncbi:MAG: Gldg family protein [Bacteroidetes bacterium]|nr:Gldg family protein [Bacteroidota bacterium]
MKTILKIARTELALLFYSPIAWFLLIALLFQSGLAYTSMMEGILTSQDMGGRNLKYLMFLTGRSFAPPYGIWPQLVGKLYLYLPLLTMGLMSREINAGTIKLLYSSPIKVREIIFGKYLSMMVYNLALVLVLALMVVFGLFNIVHPDAGMLFAGLFGIYLLLCTYAAIGLFMSCLTSYQVVAALSTLVLLAVLSYIGQLWQDIDFVRDLSYFLSIEGRADNMLLGLITTKDLIYFAVIIGMFLAFGIYKLQSDRESKPAVVKVGRYVLIVVLALTVGYISSRPGMVGYLDTTATKSMTLTVNAQKVLKEMGDSTLEVNTYVNLLDGRFWYGKPDQRNTDMARWEPYLRFKPDIKFNYIYFYDSTGDKNLFKYNPGVNLKTLAERYAKSMKVNLANFKTPEEIHKIIDLRPEQNRYVMDLHFRGRQTFLRLYDDQMVFPTETETSAALKRLMQSKMPKIAFAQGESERSTEKMGDRHFKWLTTEITFRNSLINQGFDVTKVYLKDEEIPADITGLVIADPKLPFDSVARRKIEKYIAGGGNLLIAGEPGKQEVVNPLLQPLGVQLMDGMMVQKNKDFSPELVQPYLTAEAAGFTKKLHEDAEDSLVIAMHGAAGLSFTTDGPFTIKPLAMTSGKLSWNKKIKPDESLIQLSEDEESPRGGGMVMVVAGDGDVESGDGGKKKKEEVKKPEFSADILDFDVTKGDKQGPLPAVLGLTRNINGKEQRIVVAGDADFLSNAELARFNIRTCNFDFSTGIFSWFAHGEFPIETTRPPSQDKRLTITDSGLSMLKVFLLGVLPGILLVLGSIILIRRKRK